MLTIDWVALVQDCRMEPPSCSVDASVSGPYATDCGPSISSWFFYSFILICTYMLTNLIVAVILENFSHCLSGELNEVTEADYKNFRMVRRA